MSQFCILILTLKEEINTLCPACDQDQPLCYSQGQGQGQGNTTVKSLSKYLISKGPTALQQTFIINSKIGEKKRETFTQNKCLRKNNNANTFNLFCYDRRGQSIYLQGCNSTSVKVCLKSVVLWALKHWSSSHKDAKIVLKLTGFFFFFSFFKCDICYNCYNRSCFRVL